MPDSTDELLANNRNWAAQTVAQDEEFFARLAAKQEPEFLWIGCSDSRVPATQVTGLKPGDLFVHRNVANLVQSDDPSCMAVVEYAVSALRIRHVIVCGHYGCGGVAASITGNGPDNVMQWLGPVRAVYAREQTNLDGLDDATRLDRLCEINVLEQMHSLCQTNVIQNAWSTGQELSIHAWIYNIGDGLLKRLETATNPNAGLATP